MPPRLALALATLLACAIAGVAGLLVAKLREQPAGALSAGLGGFAGSIRPPGVPAPELRGEPAIVTFVYSTCEDTCPAQVQTIRGALDDLGRDVPVLAVSVDPEGDTPARARRFVREQKMQGRMRFLLGDRAALRRVWNAYAIAPQRGELDHTATVVLVDRRGMQRVSFPYQALTADALAHDVSRLAAGA